jgi:hypothetical protein
MCQQAWPSDGLGEKPLFEKIEDMLKKLFMMKKPAH